MSTGIPLSHCHDFSETIDNLTRKYSEELDKEVCEIKKSSADKVEAASQVIIITAVYCGLTHLLTRPMFNII